MASRPPLTDLQTLEMLDALDGGQSAGQVAKAIGLSRNAVCGLKFRLNRDTDAEEVRPLQPGEVGFGQPPVARRENMDGSQMPHWWLISPRATNFAPRARDPRRAVA